MRLLNFVITALLLLVFNSINGQSFLLNGNVFDAREKPLEFVTISMFKDSIYQNSLLSDSVGYYEFPNLYNGIYKLTFSRIGFKKLDTIIHIKNDIKINCYLPSEIINLDEFVVTLKKPTIERKIDRLIFNIENSILAAASKSL